ncbi:MAG: ABC transporter permease [Candidatus Odinarchaeota archaeon]
MSQLLFLIRQELRNVTRSRYIIISFFFMPLLMWGLQIGVQVMVGSQLTGGGGDGATIFITNADAGVSEVTLSSNFTLPFAFDGKPAGTNVTSIQLSEYFIAAIRNEANKPGNESFLGGYAVNASLDASEAETLANKGKVDLWIEISAGFSTSWDSSNLTALTLHYLPSGLIGYNLAEAGIGQILMSEPFTIVEVKKQSYMQTELIELGAPGESEFSYGAGLAGFLGIMIAVMAPAPFVSTSFAGEREKRTLESLLSLPISRMKILIGKLIAGMALICIFTIMNIVGMIGYSYALSTIYGDPSSLGGNEGLGMSLEITVWVVLAISISMFLSAFISIGIGIAVASLSKDVRTSESLYTLVLLVPTMAVGMIGLFSGVPEEAGLTILYLIPWSHALAIFSKVIRPGYYDAKSLLGFGLVGDLIFHFLALFLSIAVVMFIASKIFDREGIVN